MSALDHISSALNRRDEVANQDLAAKIAKNKDTKAVGELIDGLSHKNKRTQSDCIKVLYEIGERNPKLIAKYRDVFGKLLDCKNNRLIWGAMTALDHIAVTDPKGVLSMLGKICGTADTGSVITRDHAVGILTKLGQLKPYADICLPLLIKQLKVCPDNQLPMYAEMSVACAFGKHSDALIKVINDRLAKLPKDSQKKRVLKVLKQLTVRDK